MKHCLAILLVLLLLSQTTHCQVNLNAGLLAYYPFNGNANDASGNGLNGTPQNGAQLTSDRFGNVNSAYQFDGVDDVILVHDNGALSPPSLSIAYYFLSESPAHQICIGKINYLDGNGATYNSGLNVNNASNTWFNLASPASSCFLQIPGTEFYPSVANPSVSLNQWHCIVNTFDNGTEKIYLDGILVSNSTLPNTTSKFCTNTDFLIGSWWSGDLRPFKGKIDEVRMYNRALNQDEVAALCNATVVSPTNYIINEYTEVLGFDPCKNILKVADASKFNPGDTVLLAQMKGALIDSSNSASFGNIIDYKNAGNYEFNIVLQKNGNNLNLKNNLTRQYDIPNGRVQLVRVPYFQNYTIPAGNKLTCLPWDGKKGGILAFNVLNTLTMQGDIDVSGKGFVGGHVVNTGYLGTNCFSNDFHYPDGTLVAAPKGESIAEVSSNLHSGKGALAAGGGGGNDHNSGGGGGGNATTGGLGGYQLFECNNTYFDNRGVGGKALSYSNASNKIFAGSGGGAGHCNNGTPDPSINVNFDGGNGGGIVIISANSLTAGGNTIRSNGDTAYELRMISDIGHDGIGGGGGAGTVLLAINNYNDAASVQLRGGKGGDMFSYVSPGGGHVGPGGGGAGGVLWLKQPSQPPTLAALTAGGKGGVLITDSNNPYGTTPGTDGKILFGLTIPVDQTLFTPNIDSVRIADSQSNCTDFNFQGRSFTKTSPITTWEWQFGDGASSNAQNPGHSFSNAGQFNVVLKGTDVSGCTNSDTIIVTVTVLVTSKTNDTTICKNAKVQLTILGGTTYSWSPQSTLSNSTISNPVASPANTTTYFVDITGAQGCRKKDSITVSVRPDPLFTVTPPTAVCQHIKTQLIAGGGDLYSWTPANGLDNASIANPLLDPESTTTYSVQITDTVCGNSETLATTITVQTAPAIKAQKSNDIDCSTGTSQLTATGGISYEWSPAATLTNPNIANPVASPLTATSYLVKGTDIKGCTNTDSVLVNVKATNKSQFLMPSAFTPNNDGLNDCFGVKLWGNLTDFDLKIFNRWGEQVFTTKNPTQCWDGTFRGVPQKADVYVYIIRAKSFCASSVFRKGTVTLIR